MLPIPTNQLWSKMITIRGHRGIVIILLRIVELKMFIELQVVLAICVTLLVKEILGA